MRTNFIQDKHVMYIHMNEMKEQWKIMIETFEKGKVDQLQVLVKHSGGREYITDVKKKK